MTIPFLIPLITALLQLLVFAAIPFAFYLITHRRAAGFLAYVGLYRPERRSLGLALLLTALVATPMLWLLSQPGLRELVTGPNTATGMLRRMGPSATTVWTLLLQAWVQTGLTEELLFRGFIGKRLSARLGFAWGNTLQALLFALLHGLLLRDALLTVLSFGFGWGLGYLAERAGNGSIVPNWLAHGLSNCVSYIVITFFWA